MSTDLVRVSTVTVPATATPPAWAYDLTTLATVKAELGIATGDTSQDTFLQSKLTRVSNRIQSYCDRTFQVETLQDIVYPARPAGGWYDNVVSRDLQTLLLSRAPLVSVTSVTLSYPDGTTTAYVQGTDFITRSGVNIAELIHLGSSSQYPCPWGRVETTIVYQAGFATIPYDLVEAVIQLVTEAFQEKGQDPRLMERTEGGTTTRYWVDTTEPSGSFPPDIREILDTYRSPAV